MRHYRQLTREQRYQIEALLGLGMSQKAVAHHLGVHPSTISRELRRNRGPSGYQAGRADRFARERRSSAAKANKRHPALIAFVEARLREEWSPDQIAGYIHRVVGCRVISHEWIYRHVLRDQRAGGDLWRALRHRRKRYRKRYGAPDRRGQLPGRVGIEQRPAVVEMRSRRGDWEGDTIAGKGRRGGLVSLVERTSLYTRLRKVERLTEAHVTEAVGDALRREVALTLTLDNGKEFAGHQRISSALGGLGVYFADPYCAWQRARNENINGLVRQYFPKGTDFAQVTDQDIAAVEWRLNSRPRKTLGYRTPYEVYHRLA